jgi:hypothetical protein
MSLTDNIQYTRTVEEYKKTGMPFRIDPQYAQKQRFYNKTKDSKVMIVEIRNVERIQDSSGNEWLNWEQTVRRADGWENMKHENTTDMGISKKAVPSYGGGYDEDGNLVRKITGTSRVEDVYNTPFTVENLEKLKPFFVPTGEQHPTGFGVKSQFNQRKIVVKTFEDFRDGDFETLVKTGKKAAISDISSKGSKKGVETT